MKHVIAAGNVIHTTVYRNKVIVQRTIDRNGKMVGRKVLRRVK